MNQTTLFDLEAFTKSSPSTPASDPYWDEIEIAPSHPQPENRCESLVREQVKHDTPPTTVKPYVREQVTVDTLKSAPEHSTHWVEKYWVKRGNTKHNYYRYCWMEGRKIHHCHISGGSTASLKAAAGRSVVEIAIESGLPPVEIEKLIHSWRSQS